MFKGKSIDPSLKILAIPLIAIVASVVFTVLLVKIAYPRLTTTFADIKTLRVSQNTLEERVNILREFQAGVLDDRSDVVYTTLPHRNPGALIVSQIRREGLDRGLTLTQIESNPPFNFKEDISTSEIKYKFESPDVNTVIQLLLALRKIAPLTTIGDIEIIKDDTGIYSSELVLPAYWASLPSDLPSLDEPIEDLSGAERELMARILQYKLPVFVNLMPGSQDTTRQNPFN